MPFKLRPVLFQLHLYLAIAIGLYVAILGITGSILAFETEIDHLTNAKLAYVNAAPPRLSFAELGAAIAKKYPRQKIYAYEMGEAPTLSTLVVVSADNAEGAVSVYVNPYTGQILGNRADDGLVGLIRNIHERLTPHFRPSERTIAFVSWIAVAVLFLLVSGIWLWWPRMRFGIGAGGGRPFWYDVHATLGIAAAAFIVILAVTGIIMGFQSTTTPMLYALTGSRPAPPPKYPSPPTDGRQPIPVDRAFAIAADALPGATPFAIFLESPSSVYFVRARTRDDHDPEAHSHAIIDKYTGAVLAAEVIDTAPAGTRLAAMIGAIHTGQVLGMPGKIVLAMASLTLALQFVSGAVMWIKSASFRKMIPALIAASAVAGIALYTVFVPGG